MFSKHHHSSCLFVCFLLSYQSYVVVTSNERGTSEKLIIIMANGFPGNLYRSYTHLDSYKWFHKQGVWSSFVFPVFPTYTLPNLHSFSTGDYPPKHGIVHDYMYDSKKNAYFTGGTRESDFESDWWNNSVPFWISATKAGLNVAMFYWPGCQVLYGTFVVKTCVPYHLQSGHETLSIHNVHRLITAIDNHDIVLAYYDKIDEEGHNIGRHGLSNTTRNNSITDLNHILSPLLTMAQTHPNLNLIVISTHGFTDSSRHNAYYLEDFLLPELIQVSIGYGAVQLLIPKSGKEHDVFSQLRFRRPIPKVKIYYTNSTRSELKKHYHYEKTSRIPELILIAESGYGIYNKPGSSKQVPLPTETDYTFGMHGFDNYHIDMLGLFLAYGSAFKSGYKKDPIFLTDIHDLICEIFNIDCDLNSGDISRLADILSVKPINEVKDEIVDISSNPSNVSVFPNCSNIKNVFQVFIILFAIFLGKSAFGIIAV